MDEEQAGRPGEPTGRAGRAGRAERPEPDADGLERFVAAQQGIYRGVTEELRQGRKRGHWMWFIFPQLAGLGRSETSRYYAIRSLDEARAYLRHPVLGARLPECAGLILAHGDRTAEEILGDVDAVKLRSSMTLFRQADPGEPVFGRVLERFYRGQPDERTLELLG